MAEVIWSDNATGWRIDTLAYGGSTFGQKSAEKLDSTFKAYSRLLSAHPLLGHREPLLTHIAGITYRVYLFTEITNSYTGSSLKTARRRTES